MKADLQDARPLLDAFHDLMRSHEPLAHIRIAKEKWTLAEMVAHLVDSASNNHQRFIRLRLEPVLEFPAYDAELWRAASEADLYDFADLVNLWQLYNNWILHLLHQIPEYCMGHRWIAHESEITLQELITDYYRHLSIHREMYEQRISEIAETTSGGIPS